MNACTQTAAILCALRDEQMLRDAAHARLAASGLRRNPSLRVRVWRAVQITASRLTERAPSGQGMWRASSGAVPNDAEHGAY